MTTTRTNKKESTVISRSCFTRFTVDSHVAKGVTAFRSTSLSHHSSSEMSLGRSLLHWRCHAVAHLQLLAHRTDREVHRSASFCTGYRLRCVPCPGIHLLQSVELLLLLIATIKDWILFDLVIEDARFPKLPTKRFRPSEPGIRWQWWWFRQPPPHHHGLTALNRTPSQCSPMAHVVKSPLPLGEDFGGPPLR